MAKSKVKENNKNRVLTEDEFLDFFGEYSFAMNVLYSIAMMNLSYLYVILCETSVYGFYGNKDYNFHYIEDEFYRMKNKYKDSEEDFHKYIIKYMALVYYLYQKINKYGEKVKPTVKDKSKLGTFYCVLNVILIEFEDRVKNALGEKVFTQFYNIKRKEWDAYRVQVFDYERDEYLNV